MLGLVWDLGANKGGRLAGAGEVADRFLERGFIVRTAGRKTDEDAWYAMRDGTYPDFPMVILVNGSTASAAEIVAGALRDHHRAVVVGERTYGKGSVQEVVELDRHSGAIKLTTAYYYLPSGQCIHRTPRSVEDDSWGVKPTIPVNLTERQRAKWLAAWRDLGREPVTSQPGSQPAMGATDERVRRATSQPSEEAERAGAQNALLEADLQLLKAVEYLRSVIRAATSQRASETH